MSSSTNSVNSNNSSVSSSNNNAICSKPTRTIETLTLSAAKIIASAAEKHAKQQFSLDFNIAIVDANTHLLYFQRNDNAKLTSISIATDKAFTAAGHRI